MSPIKASPESRIASIDVMRGMVILLMMLDHVRERFFMHTRTGDPIFDSIEPDLFFTRFATHFCAPMFIFLAGLSAYLYAHPSNRSPRSPSQFLFKRGMVIILIEVVLYYLVWVDSFPNYLFLQVLWAIGLCMVGLSIACRMNYWLIGALGALIVFGHNALTEINFDVGELAYIPWGILHDGGNLLQINGFTVSVSYPALPWFGVILLGYFSGPLFAQSVPLATRRNVLLGIGTMSVLLLLVLRGFNIYGETLPWSVQATTIETLMSFLNYTKYPPSLDYLLVTLGIGLIVLAWLESLPKQNKALMAIETFGSVPMFVYIVHLYVLLAAYWVLYFIFGATHGERFGLNTVMWIWGGGAVLTLLMYPLAKKFANYKHQYKHQKPWLSYF